MNCKRNHIKRKWNEEEDNQLREAVKEIGVPHWTAISKKVKTRNGKQCRERWIGMLDPNLVRNRWTPEEDALLLQKQKEMGNKWSKIARFFPDYSSITIKNRFNWLMKHRPLNFFKKEENNDYDDDFFDLYFCSDSWKEMNFMEFQSDFDLLFQHY